MIFLALIGVVGLLAEPVPVAPSRHPAGPDLASYVESHDSGAWVDWLEGHIAAKGRQIIFRDIAHSDGYYAQTRLSAEQNGQEKILALLANLPKDGGVRLRDDASLMENITAGVKTAPRPPILSDKGRFFDVDLQFPLWGGGSLLAMVLDALPRPAKPPGVATASMEDPAPTQPPPEGEVTGLIIDARQVERPGAALLPRIIDAKGRLVYGLDTADLDRVREGGLVLYAAIDPRMAATPVGARQGDKPMVVRAQSVAGATRADLVISTAEADRILKAASATAFLKECRVVVLMPPPSRPKAVTVPRPGLVAPPAAPDPNKH